MVGIDLRVEIVGTSEVSDVEVEVVDEAVHANDQTTSQFNVLNFFQRSILSAVFPPGPVTRSPIVTSDVFIDGKCIM